MPEFEIQSVKGVIPALVTPFDENGAFDEGRMRTVVRHLIGRRVNGLYVTGGTGEFVLLTPEERKRVLEVVVDEVAGRIPIIAHIGANGTRISIDLARHAEATGAVAISSVPPTFFSFSPDEIFGFYADIAAATRLPMLAYNVPLAGLMGFDMLKRLAGIERLAGVKYSAHGHYDIMRIKAEIGPRFLVYSGADEMAMSGLGFGADGVIGATYNLLPEVTLGIYDAMQRGDLVAAKELQETSNAVIFFLLARRLFAAMKRGMAWMGADAGYVRSPFLNYDKASEETLKDEFRKLRDERQIKGVAFLDAI
jgi:N-acetylneuraminate lyase